MQIAILCGGKSSRMQSEKGLILYQNKAFVEYSIEAALPISKNIQLITSSNNYDHLDYKKTADIVFDKGPIGAIYTALTHSETDLTLILSCDIPLISTAILDQLVQKHQAHFEVSICADAHRMHPLIGIYSKKIIPVLEKAIQENDLKMSRLLQKVNHQKIDIDQSLACFLKNINTPAELNELNAILS